MRRRILAIALVLLGAIPLMAIPVAGRIKVTGRAAGAALPTIVYAESLEGNVRVQTGKFTLRQIKRAFQPKVLVVPVGSAVQFPNEDEIFHNVFSLNRPEPFDLGLYRSGASQTKTFMSPGVYRVFCNIHPQMAAVLLVVPTSYIAETDANGNYRLDLPTGRYRLTAWSERSQPASVEITVSAASANAPELSLDESKGIPATHTNKFGQEYPKSAY